MIGEAPRVSFGMTTWRSFTKAGAAFGTGRVGARQLRTRPERRWSCEFSSTRFGGGGDPLGLAPRRSWRSKEVSLEGGTPRHHGQPKRPRFLAESRPFVMYRTCARAQPLSRRRLLSFLPLLLPSRRPRLLLPFARGRWLPLLPLACGRRLPLLPFACGRRLPLLPRLALP